MNHAPIAVLDSGVGGLTVAAAIAKRLPQERLVYLGDTARVPYGTKSEDTVVRYALQATRALSRFEPKVIVVACNTVSACALPVLESHHSPIPVLGVVEPGARAAVAASGGGRIAVIATEGTVRGGAYLRAIEALKPGTPVVQRACPLFVALAEEGWTEGPIPELVAEHYIGDVFASFDKPETLVLGCTHFPVLARAISKAAGLNVTLVDSAATTAREVETILTSNKLRREGAAIAPKFLATDAPERFARIGRRFLGQPIASDQVELIDLA